MITLPFSKLDANYHTNPIRMHKCTVRLMETSAIRLSEALAAADIRFMEAFNLSPRARCPHGYMKYASDLAEILSQPQLLGAATHQWRAQKNDAPPVEIYGKRGIVYFMNIPDYDTHGHIDLWDDNSIIGSDFWDAETIFMWSLI